MVCQKVIEPQGLLWVSDANMYVNDRSDRSWARHATQPPVTLPTRRRCFNGLLWKSPRHGSDFTYLYLCCVLCWVVRCGMVWCGVVWCRKTRVLEVTFQGSVFFLSYFSRLPQPTTPHSTRPSSSTLSGCYFWPWRCLVGAADQAALLGKVTWY